jgi:hypothetical protein
MIVMRGLLHWLLDARARQKLASGAGRRVALVSPRLWQSGAVELMESDITLPDRRLIGGFDLIRAANILNRHYFDHATLLRAVANVRSYLRGPGAWLLVVRSVEGTGHHGSLLRLQQDGSLNVIARYGDGSEVEALFTGRAINGP